MPVRKRKLPETDSGGKGKHVAADSRKEEKKAGGDKSKPEKGTRLSAWLNRLKYVLLILVFPPIVNYAALQQETAYFTKNATLYDVGFGQRLHMRCLGEGLPTVILDAPTGLASNAWAPLQHILAQHTKVCAYDRAGLGLSDQPIKNGTVNAQNQQIVQRSQEFTVERMADDLHRLISEVSEQPRPLLLVGAEMGGLVATFFTQLHHSEVCGLVLVNPMSAAMITQDTGGFRKHWMEEVVGSLQLRQLGAALGVNRLALKTGLLPLPLGPAFKDESALALEHHHSCHPRHLSAAVEEHFFANVSLQQMQTVLRLKPFPPEVATSVVTGATYDASLPAAVNEAWSRAVQEVLQKIPAAKHVTLSGADRKLIHRKPRLLASHVMRLVESCKSRIVDPNPGSKAS